MPKNNKNPLNCNKRIHLPSKQDALKEIREELETERDMTSKELNKKDMFE
jgi:hypothetical protein